MISPKVWSRRWLLKRELSEQQAQETAASYADLFKRPFRVRRIESGFWSLEEYVHVAYAVRRKLAGKRQHAGG